jgi:hypothetical protein
MASNPTENRRLIGHPSVATNGAKAFSLCEPVADRHGDLVAISGRPTTPTPDCHGDTPPRVLLAVTLKRS